MTFEPDQRDATARIDLPSEMRNRIARLEIEGESSAGAVMLLDERWRRRPVGLIASGPMEDQMTTPFILTNVPPVGWLLIAVVVLVLFGRGKISSLMGEVGKGITAFKKGVDDSKKEIEEQAGDVARDVTPEEEKDKA